MYNREKIQTWTQLGIRFSPRSPDGPAPGQFTIPVVLISTDDCRWETVERNKFCSRAVIQFRVLQHVFHSATDTLRWSRYGWSCWRLRFGFIFCPSFSVLEGTSGRSPMEPLKAGPFLFFTNIDLVVQAVVNWLFCIGHVMKPVREIGRILQSAFGFWGGIACTIEFWGLFLISPGLVQAKDERSFI